MTLLTEDEITAALGRATGWERAGRRDHQDHHAR